MANTPRSDRSQTRYSTPEPDLDDHRHQPESLPPAIETALHGRRGTLASLVDDARPTRPRLNLLDPDGVQQFGTISRDFEHAITDDDKSGKSVKSKASDRSRHSRPTPDEEWHRERRDSEGLIAGRKTTIRLGLPSRSRDAEHADRVSNHSSSSRRSSSPPNSVDAFAPPKRGRSGTANSKAASTENLTLARQNSNTTASRRRPTFGEEGTTGHRTDVASVRSSVQEDVCFPPEEPPNSYWIDFEDLEEFVAQTNPSKTPVAHPFTLRFTQPAQEQPRVFHDLRQTAGDYFSGDPQAPDASSMTKQTELTEKENFDSSEEGLKRPASNLGLQNRWTFFSSEIDETVHASELGRLLMPGETFRDMFELGPEGGVWWLDMLNPSEEEIFTVCGAFRVHPLTREDITTQETREKVELFKSYYFLCFRSFYALDQTSENYLEPINIYAIVFREGLLTFSFCPNPHAANVRKRIGRLRDYVNLSADWVCYALIDEIVDSFMPVLRELESEADTIEDSVFTARFEDSRAILKQIGTCRQKIMSLTRLLGGKADVIKGFAKKCNEAYAVAPRSEVGLYLSDVQDHIVTMMSNLGHFEKMLSRSHSNYLTSITLRHTEQASRANSLLGRITIFATILVPLNLFAGLFGMNVDVPGKNDQGLDWFFGIVGLMVAFALICIIVARRAKFV